jgi:DNA transformation protein
MKQHSEYLNYIMECMAFLRGLRVRGMFGGYGLYQNDLIFAIVVNDVLYLKSDAAIKNEFTRLGLQPFTYTVRNKSVIMQYFEAPPDVFEEPEIMQEWAQKALGAALRAKKPPNKALQRTRKKPRAGEFRR